MSKSSDSLQVGTDDAEACIAKLWKSGFNGPVFRGDRGWLTVVAYVAPEEALTFMEDWIESLAKVLGAPIINHARYEDFGWRFALASSDDRPISFECFSNPFSDEAHVPDADSNAGVDENFLAEIVSVERVRRFLGPLTHPAGETGQVCAGMKS